MEQGGGEKRGRAWAAGGRGLQPPPAAIAASQPALFAPGSDSGAQCAGTRAPAWGRRCSSAPERGAARRSYAGRRSLSERLGLWQSFAAQSGQRTGGEGRGKRGHTLAAARAHCTLAAARSRRGASGASLAPRLRHRHLPTLRAAPDPAPGSQTPRPLVCTAPPSPVGSNNIPITCGLWSNWSRKRRRPKAARVR